MESWTRGSEIGRGSTSTVSLAIAAVSGDLLAVKSSELSSSVSLQKEQSFLSNLTHPNIIKLLGSETTYENNIAVFNLFLEYAAEGTISDMIRRSGGRLEGSKIRSYTRQVLKGLDCLHSQGIAHCDVKSQNVLVFERDIVKISDLGCARLVSSGATSVISGTPMYMAPEVARGDEQGFPADIWALGCMVMEMAAGCSSPWPETKDPVAAMYKIGFSGESPEIPRCLPEKAKDFLKQCLRRDPRERWTAKELLDHPFLDESNCPKEAKSTVSPSSVLDLGFWESCEISQNQIAEKNPFQDDSDSCDSPVDRIGKLIKIDFFRVPDWDLTENDWMTVRNDDEEEEDEIGIRIVVDSCEKFERLKLNENETLLEYYYAANCFNLNLTHSDINRLLDFERLMNKSVSEDTPWFGRSFGESSQTHKC